MSTENRRSRSARTQRSAGRCRDRQRRDRNNDLAASSSLDRSHNPIILGRRTSSLARDRFFTSIHHFELCPAIGTSAYVSLRFDRCSEGSTFRVVGSIPAAIATASRTFDQGRKAQNGPRMGASSSLKCSSRASGPTPSSLESGATQSFRTGESREQNALRPSQIAALPLRTTHPREDAKNAGLALDSRSP